MQSIFDDENMIVYRQARQVMPMLAPMSTGQGYLIPSSTERLTYREPSGKRKRTVGEALARVQGPGSPIWKTGKQFPFTKPYAYALQGLTYALIFVDPFNRLEGGLID